MMELHLVNKDMDAWPESITDGVDLPCSRCDKHIYFDFTVSDEMWNAVVPKRWRLRAVCLPCFDVLARALGRNLADGLERVQFVGVGKTIVLEPTDAYIYG